METLFNTIITAFGWSIFHSLWQGAIIYGLLFLALTTLPRMSARLKHNLAFGAICLMFGAFLLTFVSTLKTPNSASNINIRPGVSFSQEISQTPESFSLAVIAEQFFPYLVALYIAGLLVQITLLIHSYRKLDSLKRSEHIPVPTIWHQRFLEVLTQLKIRRAVQFKLSNKVNVPLVIGYFKPLILFPFSMASQLNLQQVEAILIHELSHVRRNDFLLNLIKTCIETTLFFNPFVWLSSKFISIEREHDCDDLVVEFTGQPVSYAHALLKIEILKEKDTPALSLAASGSSQHLYHRIKRITDMKTTYMNVKQRIFAVSLTLGTIISLAWVSPAKDKEQVKTAAKDVVKHIEGLTQRVTTGEVLVTQRNAKLSLPIDTPKKKKKVKIITVDEKGNKKEYSSVSELPDTLKNEGTQRVYLFKADEFPVDSPTVLAFRRSAEALGKHINSPEATAKLEKLGLDMQGQGEAIAKRFNTPEERAKWEKLGIEMQKQSEVFVKQFNSPEENAKRKELTESLKKNAEELRLKLNSPEHKQEIKNLNEEIRKNSKELQKMLMNPEMEKQLKSMSFSFKFDPEIHESRSLRNSEEYKKLKKEFEEKVEKLKKKQERKKS